MTSCIILCRIQGVNNRKIIFTDRHSTALVCGCGDGADRLSVGKISAALDYLIAGIAIIP